jgi:CDP-diacylglycerol--glycerol-3-phosphate 3-phosphatidyltransferase
MGIFIAASFTDFLDGHIARKRGLVSDFGKFMDPLADKVLVFAAMMWFVEVGVMPAWAVLLVIVREFAVTALRLIAVGDGVVIAAGKSGKVKTAATMLCLIAMFFYPPAWANYTGTAIIVATTLYSGIEYFVVNKKLLNWTK